MRLYVPEFYRLQQKVLSRSWDHRNGRDGEDGPPTIDELILLTQKSKAKILRAVKSLQEKELVVYNAQTDKVHCRPKGELILFKEDILEEGWEKFKTNLLRWTQIIGIASATFIGVATFIWNVRTVLSPVEYTSDS